MGGGQPKSDGGGREEPSDEIMSFVIMQLFFKKLLLSQFAIFGLVESIIIDFHQHGCPLVPSMLPG